MVAGRAESNLCLKTWSARRSQMKDTGLWCCFLTPVGVGRLVVDGD